MVNGLVHTSTFSYASAFYQTFTHIHALMAASESSLGVVTCQKIVNMQTGADRDWTTNIPISRWAAPPQPVSLAGLNFGYLSVVCIGSLKNWENWRSRGQTKRWEAYKPRADEQSLNIFLRNRKKSIHVCIWSFSSSICFLLKHLQWSKW